MARRLYDILLRQQVFLDGYKNHLVKDWQKLVPQLIKDLKYEFNEVPYERLDEMTKKEFNQFKRKVALVIASTFDFWQNKLLEDLEKFCEVQNKMDKRILANHLNNPEDEAKPKRLIVKEETIETILDENLPEDEKKSKNLLWLFLLDEIIGATGMSAKEMISKLGKDAVIKINLEINKAWVNNLTIKELRDTVIGTTSLAYKNGKLAAINRNTIATIETIVQSILATSHSNQFLPYYPRVQWKAILDNWLCEVCGFLHNRIFVAKYAPSVPAHTRCRCSKIPYTGPMPDEKSVKDWKLEQPESVQLEFLLSQDLSLEEYASKLASILTR